MEICNVMAVSTHLYALETLVKKNKNVILKF
jgi:hypothetical protein